MDNEDDIAWNQIFWGTLAGPDFPNNVIIEKITRFMKERLSLQIVGPLEFWQRNNKLYPNCGQ